MDAAIDLVKPGATTDQIAAVWPKAEEFGFVDEMDAFGLQFGHGVGVGLHERPIISRLNSFDDPIELEVGNGVRPRDLLPGRRTAARPPASRRRSSSPRTDPGSSRCSRAKS